MGNDRGTEKRRRQIGRGRNRDSPRVTERGGGGDSSYLACAVNAAPLSSTKNMQPSLPFFELQPDKARGGGEGGD